MTVYRLLAWARIRLSCLTAMSCCAIAAPAPSNRAPVRTVVRIICNLSIPAGDLSSTRTLRRCFIPAQAATSKTMLPLVLPDRDPDPFGRCRHVDMVDPVLAPQSVDDCVDHCRTRPDRAGLARALHAQRI